MQYFWAIFLVTLAVISATSIRVEQLLKSLSLEAKVGQMVQIDISYFLQPGTAEVDYDKLQTFISQYQIGSLLNSPFSGGPVNGVTGWTASQWRDLMNRMQTFALDNSEGKIPLIYGIDSIHGATFIKDAALFPQAINLAASFNPSLAYQAGEITSKDTRAAGIPWIFAPVLGLGLQPLWARFAETFGEDPHTAAIMGASIIKGLQVLKDDQSYPKQTAACMKHFIAYSIPVDGHDRSPVQLPDRLLRQLYIPSFQAAIDAGVMTGMESYQEVGGVPMVSSKDYLTTLLRKEMNFEGFLVTDYAEIENLHNWHKVSATIKDAVKLAMQDTTIDMSMVPLDTTFYDSLLELVKEGSISEKRIDDSVRRILQVKEDLGLLDHPIVSMNDPIIATVGQDEDWTASLNAARESITLVKNDAQALPLPAKSKVLVTGPTCNSAISQTGGWALHWQGVYQESELSKRKTILDSLKDPSIFSGEVIYEAGPALDATNLDGLDMNHIKQTASEVDRIIICLGEGTYAEKPGDIDDLALPAGQLEYVQALAGIKPIVLVMVEGRPRLLGNAVSQSQAVVLAYQPGPVGGQAVAEILAGVSSPSGRIPFSYPKQAANIMYPYHRKFSDQCTAPTGEHSAAYIPCNMEFVFGQGLSYTNFEYSDFQMVLKNQNDKIVQGNSIDENARIDASVVVKNTGTRTAKHTVMLFAYDMYRRVTPEYKLLKRFEKVTLAPGESKRIDFLPLTKKDLQYVGVDSEYVLESGTFRLGVGADTDCRSDNQSQDWYLKTADTISTSAMCQEFELTLSTDYQPICDTACSYWKQGICSSKVDMDECRSTCMQQGWSWEHVHCLRSHFEEGKNYFSMNKFYSFSIFLMFSLLKLLLETCTSVDNMQCFDAFQMQSDKVLGSDENDANENDSSTLIITVGLLSGLGGIMLGIFFSYMYFARYIYLGSVSKEIFTSTSKNVNDDVEEALLRDEMRSNSSRAPSRSNSVSPVPR